MNRYEFVSQHINAFQHEYKMLITGRMTAEQLPTESVQGILYHMLQQLMDCYHSLSLFDNHIEFIDEVVEDYNFDAYLGVMSKGDDKTYGIENMQRAASPLLQIMDILDEGDKLMGEYIGAIKDIVRSLFARLFVERQEAIHFFGDDLSLDKALELWKKGRFMDALVDNIIICNELDDEEDRIQTVINELFIDTETLSSSITEVADDEDLPFN